MARVRQQVPVSPLSILALVPASPHAMHTRAGCPIRRSTSVMRCAAWSRAAAAGLAARGPTRLPKGWPQRFLGSPACSTCPGQHCRQHAGPQQPECSTSGAPNPAQLRHELLGLVAPTTPLTSAANTHSRWGPPRPSSGSQCFARSKGN